jgi:prevent-host-death family protein
LRSVTAREASRRLFSLLAEVEKGAEITSTKRGCPVAVVAPYRAPTLAAPPNAPEMTPDRRKLVEEALAILEEEIEYDADFEFKMPSRDEMHER